MSKFSVDFDHLESALAPKKTYKLSEVKSRLRKVAFDVVRFVDGNDEFKGLWQVRKDDSGEYIVAMYEEEGAAPVKTSSDWSVVADQDQKNVTFFYKNKPLLKKATASFGVASEDVSEVISSLPERLQQNKKLASALISELDSEERKDLLNNFQELQDLFVTR